jgi:hypothetical protein
MIAQSGCAGQVIFPLEKSIDASRSMRSQFDAIFQFAVDQTLTKPHAQSATGLFYAEPDWFP